MGNEIDMIELWKLGLDYRLKFANKELSIEERIEFAKNCIENFESFIYNEVLYKEPEDNEKVYVSLLYAGDAYSFLGDKTQASEYYKFAEKFSKNKVDHIERLELLDLIEEKDNTFEINCNRQKRIFVVDNFYSNPDKVREFALSQPFKEDLNYYKGLRSEPFRPSGIKEIFEEIIGEKITRFEEHKHNGCFQLCKSNDLQVYHCDQQKWAAMIYLTPNAPIESGTRLHRSRINGCRHGDDVNIGESFSGDFYDSTKFDIVDQTGNIYNRLVIMNARCIHSAGPYFGSSKETCRLTHLFFFD